MAHGTEKKALAEEFANRMREAGWEVIFPGRHVHNPYVVEIRQVGFVLAAKTVWHRDRSEAVINWNSCLYTLEDAVSVIDGIVSKRLKPSAPRPRRARAPQGSDIGTAIMQIANEGAFGQMLAGVSAEYARKRARMEARMAERETTELDQN